MCKRVWSFVSVKLTWLNLIESGISSRFISWSSSVCWRSCCVCLCCSVISLVSNWGNWDNRFEWFSKWLIITRGFSWLNSSWSCFVFSWLNNNWSDCGWLVICWLIYFSYSFESLNFLESVFIWNFFDNCGTFIKHYNPWSCCSLKLSDNLSESRIACINCKRIGFI